MKSYAVDVNRRTNRAVASRAVRSGTGFRIFALMLGAGVLSGMLGAGLTLRAAELPNAELPNVESGNTSATASADTGAPVDSRALRLSSVEGQVQVLQDGQVIADPAYANLPLFEGTQVMTGNDGRAEIQFEDGSIVRLSPNSTVTFAVLQQQGTNSGSEVVLNQGLAYFELQPSTSAHALRVNYGAASFSALNFAVVRVNVDTPPGSLAVFDGDIHFGRGAAVQLDLHGGQNLDLNPTDAARYSLTDKIEPDTWDDWNADRDQFLNGEDANRTAASGDAGNGASVGMSDLDANGSWYNVPGQGYVWSPYDAQAQGASWDPYGYGHWVFYPRYGYVWVSGYSWGYTPFQCGLWNYYDGFGWGWGAGAGGCSPWWGYGFGGGGFGRGWGFRIGRGPNGYHPPSRPLPGPVHPRPVGSRGTLQAVVPVDHRPAGAPTRPIHVGGNGPVVIAGHTVEPLRPSEPRPAFDHGGNGTNGTNGFVSRSGSSGAYHGGNGYSQTYRPGSVQRPSAPASRPAPAPAPRAQSYSGGGGGHSAPAASHGGGGSHR
ncbi:FecR family protein [Acidicapsa ligni]|uniref:FecR family protein n=1 Tax=Acidicapsa ligni TaxID=542300 RepID=UPI0021E079CA|nr:FecR family protein [Acidicapsa ligni]